MNGMLFTRRAALLGAASLAIVPAVAGASAYNRFRAVKVDVAPLAANGDTLSAAVIAETMPAFLQKSFAPYLAPGDRNAPTLVARVRSVYFGIGGSASPTMFNSAMDYAEGEAVVIGAGGKTIATYPITVSLLTHVDEYDTSGNYGRRRTASLGQAVAQFLPSKMGL